MLLHQVWGVQQDPEALKIHHGVCCFPGGFDSDAWTQAAVSLSLPGHYSAVCNQPLRLVQSNREATTLVCLMVDPGELWSAVLNRGSYVAPTHWKQVEMKKNVNVPTQCKMAVRTLPPEREVSSQLCCPWFSPAPVVAGDCPLAHHDLPLLL